MRVLLIESLHTYNYKKMETLNDELVKKAFEQEWLFRDATQKELLQLKKKLNKSIKKSQLTPLKAKALLLKKLKKDRDLIIALNVKLKDFPASENAETDPNKATYALKLNKMLEILKDSIEFINNHFYVFTKSIKTNQELADYRIKTAKKDITVLANDGSTIYGTSKGSIYKTVLINAELIYSGKDFLSEIKLDASWLNQIIAFLKKCLGIANKEWIDKTPNAQITPLPGNLDPHSVKIKGFDFTQCSYYYTDTKTQKGLVYTHSGYAFGAYRNDIRYPYPPGKPFGPEDCSSWIGKLTLGVDELSTVDLWNRWKYQREGYTVPSGWESTPQAQSLITGLMPVEITDPITDVVPGLVWASRSFDTTIDPGKKGEGTGGHTVLTVTGVDNKCEVKGMGYNREMPMMEGFGLYSFPILPEANKQIMFFKVVPKLDQYLEKTIPSNFTPFPSAF